VTLFIVHVGYQVTREIVHHLMDGVDEAEMSAAREAALTVPGIDDITVRGRWMGRSLHIDVEASLPRATTLETAETIAAEVEEAVHDAVAAARQVRFVPRAAPPRPARYPDTP
jgi:divalent metal cation (Fe/Co/Zn/Cd) transporter